MFTTTFLYCITNKSFISDSLELQDCRCCKWKEKYLSEVFAAPPLTEKQIGFVMPYPHAPDDQHSQMFLRDDFLTLTFVRCPQTVPNYLCVLSFFLSFFLKFLSFLIFEKLKICITLIIGINYLTVPYCQIRNHMTVLYRQIRNFMTVPDCQIRDS